MIAFAIACAAVDVRTRRIPNMLTIGGALAGLAVHTIAGGKTGLELSFFGLALNGFVFLLLALPGGMGAGDVKMAAAVGALLTFPWCLYGLAYAALAGGLLAVGMALYHRRLGEALRNIARAPLRILRKEASAPTSGALFVPYGVAIAAGAIYTVLAMRWQVLLVPR